jgi:hypothetical protein
MDMDSTSNKADTVLAPPLVFGSMKLRPPLLRIGVNSGSISSSDFLLLDGRDVPFPSQNPFYSCHMNYVPFLID